jgi:hypothetical protein
LAQRTKTGKNVPKREKMYQNGEKCTKTGENIPNDHMYNMPSSIARPSKVYTNWDFWFEKKPSGNPVKAALVR